MKVRDKNITWGLLEAYKITLTKERKTVVDTCQEEEVKNNLIVSITEHIAEIERIQAILRDETLNADFKCKDGMVFFDD